jgi:hypothetical protein
VPAHIRSYKPDTSRREGRKASCPRSLQVSLDIPGGLVQRSACKQPGKCCRTHTSTITILQYHKLVGKTLLSWWFWEQDTTAWHRRQQQEGGTQGSCLSGLPARRLHLQHRLGGRCAGATPAETPSPGIPASLSCMASRYSCSCDCMDSGSQNSSKRAECSPIATKRRTLECWRCSTQPTCWASRKAGPVGAPASRAAVGGTRAYRFSAPASSSVRNASLQAERTQASSSRLNRAAGSSGVAP